MTVSRGGKGNIVLEGGCPTEDAETLLPMLLATPAAPLDWTQCEDLHTAVLQVILAPQTSPLFAAAATSGSGTGSRPRPPSYAYFFALTRALVRGVAICPITGPLGFNRHRAVPAGGP